MAVWRRGKQLQVVSEQVLQWVPVGKQLVVDCTEDKGGRGTVGRWRSPAGPQVVSWCVPESLSVKVYASVNNV